MLLVKEHLLILTHLRSIYQTTIDIVLVSLLLTLTDFTYCSSVSIVDFKQVHASWEATEDGHCPSVIIVCIKHEFD